MGEIDTQLDDVLSAEERAEPADDEDDAATETTAEPEDPELEAIADPEAHLGIEEPDESLLEPDDDRRAPGLTRIGEILGVPLFYERAAGGPRPRSFDVAESFVPILEATVRQLRERVPPTYGQLQRISTAGLFVKKAGMHGEGRACDWDRLVFENARIAPREQDHASNSLARRRRYWAFAAICRSNSCFVLHGFYNAPHRDHIHQDSQTGVGFNTSKSTAMLCQALLNNVYGEHLEVDGDYGSNTRQAMTRALTRLGLPDEIRDVTVWRRFLRRSARLGFTLPSP